ncbi:golgin subfamily A member 6-like protein 7 isoform X3 [Pocillopora verrucosa]|uniref:golgin subfamily A member 6-like protein 7 isoform X3 n=1 Tax=Pocillopora verrucosa TaxID=203993 RepID=UPI00333F2F0E
MTDTQSPTTESQTTIDDARARSRRSFIAVLKANRDVFSNLPERIEQWLEKETGATNQPETTKHGRDESERLARSDMQKQLECFQGEINANTQRYVERELKEKEDTIEANKEQLKLVEEENLKLKEELKKKEKEAEDKITKQEERIARLEGEQEKKERQITEITREEKERTEGLINEHQKEVDKLLGEIQTIKEKLLKKSDYIQKMYEDYNKNLADHKSRNDALLEELEKREEEIAKYTQIIARLESEQEKKERQIVKITREEKEKTEGLMNEHQKEVDRLLRKIQAMKEKNETLLKEKEEEITKHTQINSKLREELKAKEKGAKEKVKMQEEEIEGLKKGHQKQVEKLSRKIEKIEEELLKKSDQNQKLYEDYERKHTDQKSRNDILRKELAEKEEKIIQYTERLAFLTEKQVKQDQRLVEDTTSANRQSELEKDFLAFFDNERLDVCDKIQSIYQNKEEAYLYVYYPRLACIIFEIAYEIVKRIKKTACDLFNELLRVMIGGAPQMGKDFLNTREQWRKSNSPPECVVPITVKLWGDGLPHPKDTADVILMNLKETADTCNLESLEESVRVGALEKWKEWFQRDESCMFQPATHLFPHLDKYIKDCLRLTWKMRTQVPPMKLEFHSFKFDKRIHENRGYWSGHRVRSESHSSAKEEQEEEIRFYLWPGLQDGGGRSIRKAEVICQME